jgi:hypothetical protein
MPDLPGSPQDIFNEFLEERKNSPHMKDLGALLAMVAKSRQQKAAQAQAAAKVPEGQKPESDCPEDVEDCSEVVSPCCNVPVTTIFGTLPLRVSCKTCGKEYLLGPLMKDLLKKPKTQGPV